MARPIKTGLDYFPLDVNIDDKIELIEAEHGLIGFAIIIKLWQKIYSNGYYIDWNDDTSLLFSKRTNTDSLTINSIINSCFKRGILDEKMFNKYKILTSSGIQKRFLLASSQSKRKSISFIKEFILVNTELTDVITEFIEFTHELSTQSKVKESKVNEIKENNKIDFEIFWNLYDKKIEAKKCEVKWNRLNLETQQKIIDYIPKYKEAILEKQFRKNPDTFLNNECWNDEIITKTIIQQNNFQVKDNRSNLEKLKATDKRLNELISQLPQ